MRDLPDHDPLLKSQREAPSFNATWLKNGEKMSMTQRIGFLIVSLSTVGSGLWVVFVAIGFLHRMDVLSPDGIFIAVGILVGLFFLTIGILGLGFIRQTGPGLWRRSFYPGFIKSGSCPPQAQRLARDSKGGSLHDGIPFPYGETTLLRYDIVDSVGSTSTRAACGFAIRSPADVHRL
jgi:hypothetical protein